MPANEARVTYKALANFLALHRAAVAAKADLASIRKEEALTNRKSVEGSKKVATAHRNATAALRSRTTSTKTATRAILAHNEALKENRDLIRGGARAQADATTKTLGNSIVTRDATRALNGLRKERGKVIFVSQDVIKAEREIGRATDGSSNAFSRAILRMHAYSERIRGIDKDNKRSITVFDRLSNVLTDVSNQTRRIWAMRSHGNISAPYIILIPVVAALLALLNPFVAILGAVGAAGFAAASSILSLGGAAISIVPMLAAAVAGVSGLLVAFQGFGGLFSKYKAATKFRPGGGGGGGGTSAADEAWNLMKATERLSDAQIAAKEAQDNLNDARKDAVKRLEDLRDAVKRDVLDEADAAARLQKATEEYYNTLADPGSTLGDKMQSLADLNDAQQDVTDAQKESAQNAKDLADAQRKGIEGDKNVVAAKKQVKSSLRDIRDAQHDLTKATAGSGGGGSAGGAAGAMETFNDALSKLSPSAQKVVLAIIGMGKAWKTVQRNVQEAFFSKFVGDMGLLAGFLPTVENLLSKAAGAMGRFVHNTLLLVTSPKWKGDLAIISDQNVRLIDLAGAAVLNLLDGLKDVVIAAGPFAERLLGSFQKLTKSFGTITSNARQTGSLARWLDIVYGRLQQWWRIIKNVAGTLFNYGAASADFGKWITDGLEKSTKTWLDASEEARRKDSPFRVWLENIKPLLREVKGLFGDFFGWLGKTAMDTDVIAQATQLISSIRTDLGPVLSDLFKTLSDSGVAQSFVDVLVSILDSLEKIFKEGGTEALKTFFDMITWFFSSLAAILKDPVWGPVLKMIGQWAGGMAALSLIGTFTGIFKLFEWLLRLTKNATILRLLSSLAGLAGLNGISLKLGAAAAGGAAAAAGGAAAAIKGSTVAGGAVSAAAAAAAAAAKYQESRGVVSTGAKAMKGSIIPKAAVAGLGSMGLMKMLGATIGIGQGSATAATPEMARRAAGGNDAKATSFLAKSIHDAETSQLDKMMGNTAPTKDEITRAKAMLGITNKASGSVRRLNGEYVKLTSAREIQQKQDEDALPQAEENISFQARWAQAIRDKQAAAAAATQALKDSIAVEAGALRTMNDALKTNGKHWDDGTAAADSNRLAILDYSIASQTTAENIRKTGGSYDAYKKKLEESRKKISDTIVALGGNRKAADLTAAALVKIPTHKQFTLTNNIEATKRAAEKFYKEWNGKTFTLDMYLRANTTTLRSLIRDLTGEAQGGLIKGLALGGSVFQKMQHLAGGGRAGTVRGRVSNRDPHGTDTEPTMLTPGEFVTQKSRVDEVGPQNMQDFNDGKLSLVDLLLRSKQSGGGFGFMDGGGLVGSHGSSSSIPTGVNAAAVTQTLVDNSMHFGDIIVNNPKQEPTSESLPSAIRKVSQVGGRRKPAPRLEGARP